MPNTDTDKEEGLRIPKALSDHLVTLLITLIVSGVTMLVGQYFLVQKLATRVDNIENKIEPISTKINSIELIEERMRNNGDSLKEIKDGVKSITSQINEHSLQLERLNAKLDHPNTPAVPH